MSLSTVSLNPSCKAEVRFKFRCCNSYTDDALVQPKPNLQWIGTAVAKVAQQCNMFVFSLRFRIAGADPVVSTVKRFCHSCSGAIEPLVSLCPGLPTSLTIWPVIRQAKVVGVLDAAFDVLVPELVVSKRGFTLTKCPLM